MKTRPSQRPLALAPSGTRSVAHLRSVEAPAEWEAPLNDNGAAPEPAEREERASGPAPARTTAPRPIAERPRPEPRALPVTWRLTWIPAHGGRAWSWELEPRRALALVAAAALFLFTGSVTVGWLLRAGPASALSAHAARASSALVSTVRRAGEPGRALGAPASARPRPPSGESEVETAAERQRAALALAQRLGIGTVPAAQRLLMGLPEPAWVDAAGPASDAPTTLLWPVLEGGFVRGYGSGEEGYHLAVDVSGDTGTAVRASASGIVGYAGDGVRGYGNIVMIIHPGGWVTMYAHNDANLVVSGERVAAGQIVARLGNTGISRGPHVHYEFMFDGKNCDPVPLFRPGVMHRTGAVGAQRGEWLAPYDDRDVVRCGRRRRHPHSRYVDHPEAEVAEAAPSVGGPFALGAVGQAAALAGAAAFNEASRGAETADAPRRPVDATDLD